MQGKRVGEVTHFYDKISVAVIGLSDSLKVGDYIHFLGRSTDFMQQVASMQIEHKPIEDAQSGSEVAIKVEQRVRRGDSVFQLDEPEEA